MSYCLVARKRECCYSKVFCGVFVCGLVVWFVFFLTAARLLSGSLPVPKRWGEVGKVCGTYQEPSLELRRG